ncbi:MAG: ABC transporter permease [Desulfobacteraceae bacterium]|nr:ABC transporter permease [Desulfobacteraceae bacterium]
MSQVMEQRTSFEIQKAVIMSLFLREMKTRFGSQQLGYLWAILEPAAIIVVFWVMFGFRMKKTMPGVDYPMFLMIGMLAWNLFSGYVTRSMNAFEANQGLFVYKQVKPVDTLISRLLVECLLYLIVVCVFIIAGYLLGFRVAIDNIPGLAAILFLFILFTFSTGLLFAVVGNFSENFKKVVGLIMRPMFFMSGIFFSVQDVPEKFRDLLLLNPCLNFLELIRTEYFAAFNSQHASLLYIVSCTLVISLLSLWLYSKLEKRIIAS